MKVGRTPNVPDEPGRMVRTFRTFAAFACLVEACGEHAPSRFDAVSRADRSTEAREDAARLRDAGTPDAEGGDADGQDGTLPDTAADATSDAARRDADSGDAAGEPDPWIDGPSLGARRHLNGDLEVRLKAPGATRVELCLFAAALGVQESLRLLLNDTGARFELRVSSATIAATGLPDPILYGYRVWGPNWAHDPAWRPGSDLGFVADVDTNGFRMNPNKILLDPYALEVSHDPIGPGNTDGRVYDAGADRRAIDSGPFAPKGIVIAPPPRAAGGPARPLADDIIYEVHLRGLTAADATLGPAAGTYEGARSRARALRELGVTAIELLPLHETPNDQNELTADAQGDNYWGYSTLSFFAPDRRYAMDRSPGGPTRELREMVAAFHAEGLKVFVDVVYNHTAEGGRLLSFRGLSNPTYYELASDATRHVNSNGVGPNFNVANPVAADLVIDSLGYWRNTIGVDGFRFDLAAIVGNACTRDCYRFDPYGLLDRIARDLPGAALIAEPWGVVPGTYQQGRFRAPWVEWNDRFRDTVRRDLNRLGVEDVTPREVARRIGGSVDVFGGRGPAASINYVVSHDGFTLKDLFSYDQKQNGQPWPYGPSSGGTDANLSWTHRGDPARQRVAARTALALLFVSAGVPMIAGGDEFLRTQYGNNNPYNIDSPAMWLDPLGPSHEASFATFAARLFAFRSLHAALRPTRAWAPGEVRWLTDQGVPASDSYLDSAHFHFLALDLAGNALGDQDDAIYVGYNGWSSPVTAHLPSPPPGTAWHLFADTSSAAESWSNAHPPEVPVMVGGAPHRVAPRAAVIFVAK